MSSKRAQEWREFADAVEAHIEAYTVPQYGDTGEDQCTSYTAAECIRQAQKYMARYGRNSRPGQQELDFKKAAHYLAMAATKHQEEAANE